MSVRGEVFSSKVLQRSRTYFFNVKENRMGDLYLNIVESRKAEDDSGEFSRQSVIVFDEDKESFFSGLDEALKAMGAYSMKKRAEKRAAGGGPAAKFAEKYVADYEQGGSSDSGGRSGYSARSGGGSSTRDSGGRSSYGARSAGGGDSRDNGSRDSGGRSSYGARSGSGGSSPKKWGEKFSGRKGNTFSKKPKDRGDR
jgi:hypothetical protein